MGYSTCFSIYSEFSKKLDLARKIQQAKAKKLKPLSEEAKKRQRAASKAWQAKRRAENLAQRELIRSKGSESF